MNLNVANMNRRKLPNLMKWFVLYLTITVFLFFFGPIHFNIRNPGLVVLYLTLYHIALLLGYKCAEKRCLGNKSLCLNKPNSSISEYTYKDEKLLRKLLWLGIIFSLLIIVRAARTANIATIISKVMAGITSPSKQYADYNEAAAAGAYNSSIFSFFITLGQPACIAAMVLSVFFFPKLSRKAKILTIVLFVLQISSKFISAANEGIFDIAIYIGVALFLRFQNRNVEHKGVKGKKKVILGITCCLLIVFALSFFTKNIIGRTQGNFAFGTLGENYFDANAGINKYIPSGLFVTFVYLTAYLCEGYYGFALSTTIDWVPNFGMGFSSFIRNNMSDLLGVDFFQYSYQVRISEQYEWGALKNFHTAYTFWANDVGYIGVVLVMFIIGYVFCRCYYSSIFKHSKISIVLMPLLVTMLFYLPANNKIFVQPTSFLLIFYICIYIFIKSLLKKRRNRYG